MVPKVLSAYCTSPKTHKGNSRTSRAKELSLAALLPPAISTRIARYTTEATKVEIMELATAKTVDHLLATESEDRKPTIAASRTAGPKLFAGAIVYSITARN